LISQSSTPTVKVTRGLAPISLGFHIATKCTRLNKPPTDSSGVAFQDAKEFWTNYKGYKHLGLGGPTGDYACPVHLIWFPQINKTDSDV
jgi:hypothetical protein